MTLKKSVLDPQGSAVEKALATLGYENVRDVRVGKYMELYLEADTEEDAGAQVEEMCRRLLTNPVIEEYTYHIVKTEGRGGAGSSPRHFA